MSNRQIKALISACLCMGGLVGIFGNCLSIILGQLQAESGLPLSVVASYNTIDCVTGAVVAGVLTRLYFKSNKALYITLDAIISVTSFILLVLYPSKLMVYFAAFLYGCVCSNTAVLIPDILSDAFKDKNGTPTGIAFAFSGIFGAIFNPIFAKSIEAFGLMLSVFLMCLVLVLIVGISIMLFIETAPADAQKIAPESNKKENFSKPAFKIDSRLLICCIALLASGTGIMFNNFITIFAGSVGYGLMVSSLFASLAMIGNIAGKVLFGISTDYIGIWKTMFIGTTIVCLSFICFLFFNNSAFIMYVSSFLYGFVFAIMMMSAYQFAPYVYDRSEINSRLGTHSAVCNGYKALTSIIVGLTIDRTGNFNICLYALIIFSIISGITILYCQRKYKYLPPIIERSE